MQRVKPNQGNVVDLRLRGRLNGKANLPVSLAVAAGETDMGNPSPLIFEERRVGHPARDGRALTTDLVIDVAAIHTDSCRPALTVSTESRTDVPRWRQIIRQGAL